MGNVKDEGKKMDPLFPRLHISDADKGGPRNKMALSHQLNLPLQTTQRCIPGSVSPILPLSNNNGSTLQLPGTSSYHDASYKRSVFSSFGSSCGSTRLATRLDSYHSSGINLNISLTTVKQTIETTNCQTLCNAGHLKHNDYRLFKPQEFKTTRNTLVKKLEDDDDYLVPSLSFGIGQHSTNREKFPHPIACRKQSKSTDKDAGQENKLNTIMIKDISKEHLPCYSDRVQLLSEELATSNPEKRSLLVDEPQMLHDSNISLPLKRIKFQENMAYKDVLVGEPEQGTRKTSTSIWPTLGDNCQIDRCSHEDVIKIKDISETNFVLGHNIAPEEVSQMIGPEQYCKARRTIIQQQRVFQSQLFELHRLIKVQKLLAESPDLLLEDAKMATEDAFPHVDHLKKERCLSLPIESRIQKPFHNDEKRSYNPNSIDLPPLSSSAIKQPPLCFLPPPGNQWLVPVRSPSEGLVYKPYAGPCPPPVGLVAPVYGMNLAPSNGDFLNANGAYNIPTSCQQGLGVFPNNTPLFTSYGFPTKRSCSSPTFPEDVGSVKPIKTTCHVLSPDHKWPSLGELKNLEEYNYKSSDLAGGSSSFERKKGGDELPLFPTKPMVQDSDQLCTKEKVKGYDHDDDDHDDGHERINVIKVVPHNPKLASESAARIYQFIQEERQTK